MNPDGRYSINESPDGSVDLVIYDWSDDDLHTEAMSVVRSLHPGLVIWDWSGSNEREFYVFAPPNYLETQND